MKSLSYKKLFFILIVPLLLAAAPIKAAKFLFSGDNAGVGIGGQFEVTLKLDTEMEKINAIEGKLVFSDGLLELKDIRDGSSVINFWIERPKLISAGEIIFSGVIPGGYNGKDAPIFSVIFTAKKEGSGAVALKDIQALLNDGSGTPAKVSSTEYPLTVSASGRAVEIPKIIDQNPPESFVPEVGSDPDIFGGKYFVAFVTQDKGLGMDYYEVKEKSWLWFLSSDRWLRAESPVELKDQRLGSYIYVKAVDKSGNERVEKLMPLHPWYQSYLFWSIILVGFLFAITLVRFLWRRKTKSTLS